MWHLFFKPFLHLQQPKIHDFSIYFILPLVTKALPEELVPIRERAIGNRVVVGTFRQ